MDPDRRKRPTGRKPCPPNEEEKDEAYIHEKEKEHRRKMWLLQKMQERQHEEKKRKMVEEYERKRWEQLRRMKKGDHRSGESETTKQNEQEHEESPRKVEELQKKKQEHSSRVTKERSRSAEDIFRTRPSFSNSGYKSNCTSSKDKHREDDSELRKITIKIIRNIPRDAAAQSDEIRRELINNEDVILLRRDGEGSKPIFDRDELMQERTIEEKRIIIKNSRQADHSRSGSSPRKRSRSRSREQKYHRSLRSRSKERSHRSPRRRSYSRERKHHSDYKRSHSREHAFSRYHDECDYPHCPCGQKCDKREHEYPLPIPPPMYYGPYPPRPRMMGPMMSHGGHFMPGPPPPRAPMHPNYRPHFSGRSHPKE